jgi:hypothetical protein
MFSGMQSVCAVSNCISIPKQIEHLIKNEIKLKNKVFTTKNVTLPTPLTTFKSTIYNFGKINCWVD